MNVEQIMQASFRDCEHSERVRSVLSAAENGDGKNARAMASLLGASLNGVHRYALFDAIDALLQQEKQKRTAA